MQIPDEVKFGADGLIPAVIQDSHDGQVLMVGFMNRDALEKTLAEGKVCFWSRSRQKFWLKGESSGNFLLVKEVLVNCYVDSLLIKAEPVGPTCHNGYQSCYYRKIEEDGSLKIIAPQLFNPKDVYGK
ncbi:MAG: phosphoribosyl-AMP cyclohydrolase [Armatimonadota bacterium]|jgi:phosphoribosyl-AMP cyclohydrolase|nr:phosphoribosyl-AMP cyclohydrolase [Armatimonadota bacterium]